jgi:hypothetical protein
MRTKRAIWFSEDLGVGKTDPRKSSFIETEERGRWTKRQKQSYGHIDVSFGVRSMVQGGAGPLRQGTPQ